MKIKDKEAEAMIRRSRVYQVAKRIDEYPETDVGSRSDLQILADETSYVVSCYNDSFSSLGEEYRMARRILQETRNGTRIIFLNTGSPMYKPSAIQGAKDIRNEYIRTTRLMASLNQMGIRGRWQ